MKKAYAKPEIMFESFASSTNIAANCKMKIDTFANGDCAYMAVVGDKWEAIFLSDIPACEVKDGPETDNSADGAYGGYCYHVPVDGNSLFNS